MINRPGPIAMLGSGETSLAGGRVFEAIAKTQKQPLRVALLETPAGFELNAGKVTGKVADFLSKRLQNYDIKVDSVPARKRGTQFSPDNESVLEALLSANLIFMGPGSPTYAVRQLKGSLAWDIVRARHRQGAALVFSSAAMIAVGKFALPVYEIFKVGEDVHTVPGLDLFADFGFNLSFIPHWNNSDGGEDVDTSRCFIGQERFIQWCDELPKDHTTLGLDEHTGLIIDFAQGSCTVNGVSSATLLRDCDPNIYPSNAVFSIEELGEGSLKGDETIRKDVWDLVNDHADKESTQQIPGDEVLDLLELRKQARNDQNWEEADNIRGRILKRGWKVKDTPNGQELTYQNNK
ncbi:cysteinyl-tRNA synthetase [Chloroflexota bacterium]